MKGQDTIVSLWKTLNHQISFSLKLQIKDNQIFVTIIMQFSLFQFKEGDLRPVNDDILIAKLRPGQVFKITYW